MSQSSSEILAYVEPWVVSPGQDAQVKVSTDRPSYTRRLVRLIQGNRDPKYAPVNIEHIESVPVQTYPGRHQDSHQGSYAVTDLTGRDLDPSFKLDVWAFPTLPSAGHPQVLASTLDEVAKTGFALLINELGQWEMRLGDGEEVQTITTDFQAPTYRWVHLVLELEGTNGHFTVEHKGHGLGTGRLAAPENKSFALAKPVQPGVGTLYFATGLLRETTQGNTYNGRLDSPTISSSGVIIAKYDFAKGISTQTVHDEPTQSARGRLVNMPTRGVRGHDWDATWNDFTVAKYGYGAIHFHEDDVDDAGWETDFSLTIPSGARSGAYAVELTTDDGAQDEAIFFVRPRLESQDTKPRSKFAFLMGTFTYLAYANERMFDRENLGFWVDADWHRGRDFNRVKNHKDYGISMYDKHRDGHGCTYSSYKRPLLNLKPSFVHWGFNRPREFSADLMFIQFLENNNLPYEVITDHDLNAYGLKMLDGCHTLVTGCHPEYPTLANMRTYTAFCEGGGNLLYLGGNGAYWVTGNDPSPDQCHRIEVRRGIQGMRAFTMPPGERHLSMTGELGGLWRHRGFASNLIWGLGTDATGLGAGVGFKRSGGSLDPSLAWMFEGIAPDDDIGGFGGGASGDEIDRYEPELGGPDDAVIVATSRQHSRLFNLAIEEAGFPIQDTTGPTCDKVRSDIVFFRNNGGGIVFGVGTINWIWNMGWSNYDNSTARLTLNVLKKCQEESQ